MIRLATHSRMFHPPTPLKVASEFCKALRAKPNCVPVSPGPLDWALFAQLCRQAESTGNLVPDACLTAIVVEHGCELIPLDRDFGRFSGLVWIPPAD